MRESLIDDVNRVVKRSNLAVDERRDYLFAIALSVNAIQCQLTAAHEALSEARAGMHVADRILADHQWSSQEAVNARFDPTDTSELHNTAELLMRMLIFWASHELADQYFPVACTGSPHAGSARLAMRRAPA